MWPGIFDFLATCAASICCSLAVKLTDDYLDMESDLNSGRRNLATVIGPGAMVYALILLAVAAGINASISLSLFFGSYIIGMYNDFGALFPSRLKGWQESLIILAVGIGLWGVKMMLFSLFIVLAVQLLDDCIDQREDRLAGQRNMAVRFGGYECFGLAIIGITAAGVINARLWPAVITGIIISYCSLLIWSAASKVKNEVKNYVD